ncbi:hypothetical protein FN846DRAFT_969019 [Sphaerosporella brunnea]|uniref:Trypsin-like cysteine/serine peptidase domain-containing protein n=1 Tax=Sphaerosporella brunnea TaxID=1250544 RepID=A0A5J5ELF4_9PEZI|nr:hypothetical protein FN846DRAFT_969019 [Sphaerosporella brunnea]
MSDNECGTGTDLSETQKPTDSPEGEASTEQDLLSALGFEGGVLEERSLPEGNPTAQYGHEDPDSDPYGIQRLALGNPCTIGILPEAAKPAKTPKLKNTTPAPKRPKPQTNKPRGENQGLFVYQLRGVVTRGNIFGVAIYIGKGFFLTAAHNMTKYGDVTELRVIGKGNDEHQVEVAANLKKMDLAILECKGAKATWPSDYSRAIKPYIRSGSGPGKLRFWGINMEADIRKELRRFDISTDDRDEIVKNLRADEVSTVAGDASYPSGCITYNISSVEGASGSAITTDSLKKPELMGIHAGFFTKEKLNGACDLNSPHVRKFFQDWMPKMMKERGYKEQDVKGWAWREFSKA